MAFTSSTTFALLEYGKTVSYKLELKTNFPQSNTWQEYPFQDFTLTRDVNAPAILRVSLLNDNLDMSDEASEENHVQLFAGVRFSCTVGAESEVLFSGRVFKLEPRDYTFQLVAQDWLALLNECGCEVSLSPVETDEISPARQLALVGGGAFGSTYGFTYSGAGDPTFNEDASPGTRRRSWAAGDIQLWYDSAATRKVPPRHYQVNLTSGTVSILEDTAGNSYHATGVRCYKEGSPDWADVFKNALMYPAVDGGIGAGESGLDMPDTGVDLAGPLYFRGKVSDLVKEILSRQQQNLRLWFDSDVGKFKLRLITQKGVGNEDWVMIHPQSISQPRDIRSVYSRVVVTGRAERPQNALALPGTVITDETTQGNWFAWDGLNVGGDDSFSNVSPNLYDGDLNLGAGVHNLADSENGGSDKYGSWYNFIKVDLGKVSRVSRIRVTTPGSRNVNAPAGHQGLFWPGVKLYGSEDDIDYRLITAHICGRYPPGEELEASGKDILMPKLHYIKVQLGAYKHGFENQDDPSIGLAELEIYTTEVYEVAKEIDGNSTPLTEYEYTADYDRDGSIDTWQRNHPALWARLGLRHRTLYENQSGQLNEYLAHDRALDLLAESVRLFQQVVYRAVCDPRIRLYDTVSVTDELNGDVGSILVERVVLSRSGAEISGTNYLAGALGES